jgi:hypothetical protein
MSEEKQSNATGGINEEKNGEGEDLRKNTAAVTEAMAMTPSRKGTRWIICSPKPDQTEVGASRRQ